MFRGSPSRISSKGLDGATLNHSFVIRGYVRKWCKDVDQELERLSLIKMLTAERQDEFGAAEVPGEPMSWPPSWGSMKPKFDQDEMC
jgi:hypothetical protein